MRLRMAKLTEDRVITTIYIKKDVRDYCKEYGIKLSEWVDETFTEKFLSMDSKIDQLKEHTKITNRLREEIRQIKERKLQLQNTLSSPELNFINKVPEKIEGGFNIVAIKNQFNYRFKKKLSLDEFRTLIS